MRATRTLVVATVAAVAVTTVIVVAANFSEQGVTGGIARAPLDRRWDERMLAGAAEATPDIRRGRLVERDLEGVRWLGAVRGAGWEIVGGRLQSVPLAPGALELHGKRITLWRGGLLGLDTHARLHDTTYQIFLLHRPDPGARAVVIETWDIPASDVVWTLTRGWWHDDVGAFMSYDPATTVATVRITGLARAFARTVRTAGRLAG